MNRPPAKPSLLSRLLGVKRHSAPVQDQDVWRHATMNATGDAIWLVDSAECLLDINAAACALFGLSRPDCLGRSLAECAQTTSPALRENLQASFDHDRRVLQSGRILRSEEHFAANSGLLRSFDVTRTPVVDADGKVIGVTTVARENTAIRIHQTELKRLHARMQSILNSVSEGILVSDRFGLVTFANPAVTKLVGWEGSDLMGNYQHEILQHSHADGRPYNRNDSPVNAVLQDGQTRLVEDEIFWCKNGRPIPVEYTCSPVMEDHRVSGVAVVFRDITQRRQTAEELSRLHRAIEHCPVSIVVTDPLGQIQFVNPAFTRITGFMLEDVQGFTPRMLKSGYHNEEFYRQLWSTITSGQSWEGEMCNRKKDGTLYWEMARIAPVTNIDGKIINYVAVKEDISQRYALQEALRSQAEKLAQSNADLEQFAYAVSHDLQEPLRMVTSYMQLLRRRYGEKLDEDAHEFINFAVDAGQRLTQMIADLLAYSRVQTRASGLQPVNLNEAMESVRANLFAAITESDAQLEVHPLPTVMGDQAQLVSLLQNLIGNALKYRAAETRPHVRVSALREGELWHLMIRDNGIGIEEEHFDRIFGVFQRLHARDAYEGTGIGLALCKRVVDRHGGRIWVESVVGQGSTFHITLPSTLELFAIK